MAGSTCALAARSWWVDLTPLLGQMTTKQSQTVYDGLLEANRLVQHLGQLLSERVGEPCSVKPFVFSVIRDRLGSMDFDLSAYLSCGDVAAAFEVFVVLDDESERPPPWPVEAWLSVGCTPRPRAYACTHDVMVANDEAVTPEEVVRILQAQIRAFTADLPQIPREVLIAHGHDDARRWP
jgi:hypothetical protein